MNETELLVKLCYLTMILGLFWAIVCRVNRMSRDTTKATVRAIYTLVGAMVFGAGTLPFWRHDWAQWAALTLAATHLITTVANSKAWRNGPPPHARSKPAAFDPDPHHHHSKGTTP